MLKRRLVALSLSLSLSLFFPLAGASNATAQGAAPNQLSEAEKKEGWALLFDGKAIQSWRGYQKPDMTGLRWVVQDGCLALPPSDGTDTRGERDIISTKQYGDFDLTWEWRISEGGNSGVK